MLREDIVRVGVRGPKRVGVRGLKRVGGSVKVYIHVYNF